MKLYSLKKFLSSVCWSLAAFILGLGPEGVAKRAPKIVSVESPFQGSTFSLEDDEFEVYGSWFRLYEIFMLDRLIEDAAFVHDLQELFDTEKWKNRLQKCEEEEEEEAASDEEIEPIYCLRDPSLFQRILERIQNVPFNFPSAFFSLEEGTSDRRPVRLAERIKQQLIEGIALDLCGALSTDALQALKDVQADRGIPR